MEDFASKLEEFEPDLLVVGGLQMMDNFPFQAGDRKLAVSFTLASVTLNEHFHSSHISPWIRRSPLIVLGERKALLSRLANLLSSSRPQIGVHFEMASFVEESIMQDLLHYVVPHVCSLWLSHESMHG